MRKYLVVIVFIVFILTENSFGSPTRNNSVGLMGTIAPLAIYGLVNFIPANYEYDRHRENETSYTSIYWFGFVGGILGTVIGGKALHMSGFGLFGSMLVGIVVGNRFGHFSYARSRKSFIKYYPSFAREKLNIRLEMRF